MRSDPGPAGVAYLLHLLWERRPRRTVTVEGGYKVQFEHPTQLLASTFLRAIDGADGARLMQAFKRLVENPLGMLA